MRWSLTTFMAYMTLGCHAHCHPDAGVAYDFNDIKPSVNLTWSPCFDDLACSRLQVPLDYSNRSLGSMAVAFIKLAGKNASIHSPSIVIIPGGPGSSGVDLLLSNRDRVGTMFGEQYNYVSFDPRGVNNSDSSLDCFLGSKEARFAFGDLHSTGVTNTSSSSLAKQYYSSSIYGEWCNNAVQQESRHGYYVTTPAVARDLLTFVEVEAEAAGLPPAEAKLWAYGISYGTVIGSTFASLFPDRVGRMVLDGVVNAEQYYNNDWRDNVDDMDEAMLMFAIFCHSAGRDKCSFWGLNPADILTRIDGLVRQLRNHPVAISRAGNQGLPALVTYSDLKALFLNTVYSPVTQFPFMADTLSQVERGDASALVGMFEGTKFTSDARLVIQCTDGYRKNKLKTIQDFRKYVDYTASKSKYIGDIYPIFLETILCRSFEPNLPDSMTMKDSIGALDNPTSFPILFASNKVDPITPLKSAREMSSRFAGSKLLVQEAVGHTVVNQGGSTCYFQHIQAYFQGQVPKSNTACSRQYTPFIDGPLGTLPKL